MIVRTLFIAVSVFLVSNISFAQQDKSVGNYGESINKKGAVSVKKLPAKLDDGALLEIKVKGTIIEVCQAKGCWMTLDVGNDESVRVKFKDYGFFVPKDAAGKKAIIRGVAKKEIIEVDELKHLAEDAGKSKNEIDAIDKPKEELTFVADGVIIK